MDSQLFIRVRGRVLGPYDQEKLQSLARRGQLSRMHELSTDGASWVRASNFPELFIGNPVESPSDRQAAAEPVMTTATTAAPMAAMAAGQAPAPSGQQWHYTSAGVQRGPVDFANLQLLCASGQIAAADLVWSDGMPAWMPASHVPGLIRAAATATAFEPTSDRADRGEIPDRMYRSAYSSKPWVVFIMIAHCIYAGLEAIGGMWMLILGARFRSTVGVAWGMFALVGALDVAIGAYLLNVYISRMSSLQYSPKPVVLEKVHDSLRGFWIFIAVNLIIGIAIAAFFVIWIFAAGVTLPTPFRD
jgi:GYF domain 2